MKKKYIEFRVIDPYCMDCHVKVFDGHCVCSGYSIVCCEEGYKFRCLDCIKAYDKEQYVKIRAQRDILKETILSIIKGY